jgi:hypothetical protein
VRFHYSPAPVLGGPGTVFLPLLPIRLHGPSGHVRLTALVDSGSVETTIPDAWLSRIGIPIAGEEVELVGFGGARTIGRVTRARVSVAGDRFAYDSRIVSSPESQGQPCILGYRDFFMNFRVTFDARHGVFLVNANRG